MKRLHDLFRRYKKPGNHTSSEPPSLSDEVLAYLSNRDLASVQNWLQTLLRNTPNAAERLLLPDAARAHAWPEQDIKKLEVIGHYYRGDFREAYNLAMRHAGDQDIDPDLFIISTYSLYHLGLYEQAYQFLSSGRCHESRLAGRQDYAMVAALVCQAANQFGAMKHYIDEALRLAPNDPVTALNAYSMYFELGDMEAFERIKARFDEGGYPFEPSGFALATVELAQDHYSEGFRLLEARYLLPNAHRFLNRGLFQSPRWLGEPLSGKHLLVSAEQGLGDTLQMARYLPELKTLGAHHIVLETQPETLTLLQHNFPDIPMVERLYGVAPNTHFDYWTGLMSLPYLLSATTDNIPGKAGYLSIPPDTAHYWQVRVKELSRPGKVRIGIAWSGRPTHRADLRRSIPEERIMAATKGVDADFFILQTRAPAKPPVNLIDVSEELITLADTGALVDALDLIITVDTSVVHLAGALGRKAWLLLPYRYEWRWGLTGEKNHWYDSVTVLRQYEQGDWDSLLDYVFTTRLPEFCGKELRGL